MGDQLEEDDNNDRHSLRPPPRLIHHPSPRSGRQPALFSLTPLSATSSSSSHNAEDDPDGEDSMSSPDFQNPSPTTPGISEPSPTTPKSTNGNITPPHKSRSILNLTSSTLFGIYSKSGYDANRDESETPWGTGTQTPSLLSSASGFFDQYRSQPQITPELLKEKTAAAASQRDSDRNRVSSRKQQSQTSDSSTRYYRRGKPPSPAWRAFDILTRAIGLFLLGMAYGMVITHLHDSRNLAPVKVEGINRGSWFYLCSWGSLSILLGFLLPWIDSQWEPNDIDVNQRRKSSIDTVKGESAHVDKLENSQNQQPGAEWNPIVRSVGAFVGIAFAIRRLPWQSTLQVSLTLLFVNPVLWYLLDRTKTGFALSLITGISGVAILIGVNPHIVPSSSHPISTPYPSHSAPAAVTGMPSNHDVSAVGMGDWDVDRYFSMESVGVATWILSVFFCSCVCFGNVGRRIFRGVS